MKKLPLILLFAFMAVVVLYLLGQLRQSNESFYPMAKNMTEESLLSYQSGFEVMLMNDDISLDGAKIYDVANKTEKPLSTIFNNSVSYYFVLRFNEYDCEACVEYAYQKIVETFADKKNVSIAIMKDVESSEQINNSVVVSYGENEMKKLNVLNMELPIDAAGVPHFFVLTNDLKIHDVFVPDRMNPDITNRYLEMVVEKWFK